MIYLIAYTKEAVMRQTECFNINQCMLSVMTVNVKLELTAYLLGIDECRHVIFYFILLHNIRNSQHSEYCNFLKSSWEIDE